MFLSDYLISNSSSYSYDPLCDPVQEQSLSPYAHAKNLHWFNKIFSWAIKIRHEYVGALVN